MKFERVLILDLPILRNPFAKVSHRALYVPDGAKYTSVVVVELVLCHKIGCYSLYYVHFFVQVFDFSDVVLHRFVEEGSIRYNVTVQGKVASN